MNNLYNLSNLLFRLLFLHNPWKRSTGTFKWLSWQPELKGEQYFYLLLFTTVMSLWDFSHGEIWVAFPGESQLRQSRATQPTVHTGCFSVSIIHQTLTWTTGSWTITCTQMLMHVIAHGGVRTHIRVCTESWLWEKNPLPHWGIEPASVAWRSDALTNWATFPILPKKQANKKHVFHMWLSFKSVNESDVNKWIQETVKSWEKWIKPQSTCGSLAPRINEHDWGDFNFNAFFNG